MAYPGYSAQAAAALPVGSSIDPEVQAWYIANDYKGTRNLEPKQLQTMLMNNSNRDSNFSLDTCRLLATMVERDFDTGVSLYEFQSIWDAVKLWRQAFQRFDSNRTGFIDVAELDQAIRTFGFNLSPQLIQKMFYKFDSREQGRLSLDDFIRVCVTLRGLTDHFRRRDTSLTGNIKIHFNDYMTLAVHHKH